MSGTEVTKAKRLRIFTRDDWTCQGCGDHVEVYDPHANPRQVKWASIDHKTPTERGGTSDESNLWLLCNVCNGAKAQRTVDEWERSLEISGSFMRRGFTAVPNGLLGASDLSMGARMALICLLSFAWKEAPFPGQKRLGEMLGCTDRTVREYLAELRDAGYIRVERRGRGRTNVYRIDQAAIVRAAEKSSAPPVDDRNDASALDRKQASGEVDEVEESQTLTGLAQPAETSAPPAGRDRDEVWDAVEAHFGSVSPKTNAHGKRNKAVADLKRLGATPASVTAAARAWPRLFDGATLTDVALATHYPQLIALTTAAAPTTASVAEIVGLPELSGEELAANRERAAQLAAGIGRSAA